MNKRRRIFALVAILGLAVLVYLAVPPKLPCYQGKSLAVWFEKLPPTEPNSIFRNPPFPRNVDRISYNNPELHRTLQALQAIGTNGLPFIMKKFTGGDSRVRQWLGKTAAKLGWRVSVGDPTLERRRAVTALLANSPLPPDTVDKLTVLSCSADKDISSKARSILLMTTGGHTVTLE